MIAGAVLFAATMGFAQNGIYHLNFELGGGVTPTEGQTSHDLTTGWNGLAGVSYRFDEPFAVRLELMYNGLGISQSALNRIDVPDGNAHIWSLTLDPVVHLGQVGPFSPYVIFGGGFYRRTVQFTKSTTTVVTVYDPWWGYIGPAVVPTNQVLGTVTRNAGGTNVGAGLSVKVGRGAHLFVEARYHYVWTERRATEMLPITFGVRW